MGNYLLYCVVVRVWVLFGCSGGGVVVMPLERHGLPMDDFDREVILKYYERATWREMGEMLGRTGLGVKSLARKMGVSRKRGSWTMVKDDDEERMERWRRECV